MTVIANAGLVLKDSQGNKGIVKPLTDNDINKISNAITDVGQVVDPATHMPIKATTASVGVVQLATAQDITNGTAGKVVDAKELAEVANKANAITVSGTAPNVSTMPVASGVMHPSQDIITEDLDVSILALQQDLWGYKTDKSYTVGSYVMYQGNIYKCIQNNTVTINNETIHIAPTDAEYWLKVALNNELTIIGEIKYFAFNTAPEGYLVCNGATVSRETYADLFAVIGTTFGSGDGSTTFTLPNLIDKFAQGSTTVGTVKSAGLPNITGTMQLWQFVNWEKISTGAISNEFTGGSSDNGDTGNKSLKDSQMTFNANKSNGIYGNSTTVQPPALTLLPCIKY